MFSGILLVAALAATLIFICLRVGQLQDELLDAWREAEYQEEMAWSMGEEYLRSQRRVRDLEETNVTLREENEQLRTEIDACWISRN